MRFLVLAILPFSFLMISCTNNTVNNKNEEDSVAIPITPPQIKHNDFDTLEYIRKNKENGQFWQVSQYKLQPKDLNYISPSELRIIRNEIFAKKGYIFKSEDLKNHFEKENWYKPLFPNVDKYLTDLERENIKVLQQKEKSNSEISKSQQLEIFISYQDSNNVQIPKLLAFKFGESCMDCLNSSFQNKFIKSIFPQSNNKHLLFESYLLCDQCDYEYNILTYSLSGDQVSNLKLGSGQIEMVTDSSFKFIEIKKTINELYKDSVDVLEDFDLVYDIDSTISDYILKNDLINKLK